MPSSGIEVYMQITHHIHEINKSFFKKTNKQTNKNQEVACAYYIVLDVMPSMDSDLVLVLEMGFSV